MRFPLGLVAVFILAGASVALPVARPAAYNVLLVVAFFFALQGLAVVAFLPLTEIVYPGTGTGMVVAVMVGEGVGVAVGTGEALAVGVAVGETVGDTEMLGVGVGVGEGVGVGVGV